MPDRASFSLILCAGFLVSTNYFAFFPTVREYTEYTGADETFFGWVLSIQKLIQALWIIPIDNWIRRSYKVPMVFLAATGLIGNSVYALGYPFKSKLIILLGNAATGIAGCIWIIYRKYVSEATGVDCRTKAFAALMLSIALGYAVGPLLGVAVCYVDFEIGPVPFNRYTNPGWAMGAHVAFIFHLLFFLICGTD